jgi:chromosome segregation ATPase
VTDRSQSVEVKAFEHVLVAPGTALLRVLAVRSRRRNSPTRPNLVVKDEQSTHRFAPLPAPGDPRGVLRVAYSVPVELLEHQATFTLEFQGGAAVTLPEPTAGSIRPPAGSGQRDDGKSGIVEAEPDADLDEVRRQDLHEQLVQQSQALAASERAVREHEHQLEQQAAEILARTAASDAELAQLRERANQFEQAHGEASAALRELETWREELERRLADLTTELAATKQAFEEAEGERRRLDGALAESEARTELAEGGNADLSEHIAQLSAQLSEREAELAEAVQAADDSSARADADRLQGEIDAAQAELERLGAELDAAVERASEAKRTAQEHGAQATELQALVISLEQAVARAQEERSAQDRSAADAAGELDAIRAAQAQAQATVATLLGDLKEAKVHAARSSDLEREVEASRAEADRLQAAVVRLESESRPAGQAQSGSLQNGADGELAAVRSALDGVREEMSALRLELEAARAAERKANLGLVMLTAETQARLQAQTELRQAALESGLTQ